ncbi:MAG TPA: hypothetical protein IAB72_02485 [Candidatus Onthoplasma faecipullorum]|nr:hypothetical protein [Candidatus Onthoplasma faecipullorum]
MYNEARSYSDKLYEKLNQNIEQYKGSKKIDGSEVDAKQVRNITYELVESQVTSYLPTPAVSPKMYNDRNERNAKSIETLLRNKRNELPFEKLNDIDERFNPIYGGSIWLIEWDNSITTHNTVGDVKISCLSPKKFTGQPNIYDVKEMEYCFIEFETTKEDIVRKYGVAPEVADETESEENSDDKTATLYVCYYKNDADKVCQYIWSADTELSDIEDYYARKRYVCKKCGKRKEICSCEKGDYELQNEGYEELEEDIILTDGEILPAMSPVIKDGQVVTETVKQQAILEDGSVALEDINGVKLPMMVDVQVPKMEKTKLPFYTPNILPIVIRKNTSEEDSLLGQSDVEFIRPQQQAINKIESRIVEKLMGSGVFPIVPEEFNGEIDNSIWKKVFRAKPSTFNMFGRVDLQVDITRDIAQSDRLYDQAKRILGISDSYQGQYDASAQSGKAKQIQVNQAAGRLDSKRQMKNAAYAEIDQIIFQYYLAYADEPRPASYKDAMGRTQNCMFNRYDFIERDEAGEYYYNDEYLFSTDATVDVERNRETLWQENRINFQQGAYGDPTQLTTLLIFWLNMEKAHYPWAHDNVERIKEEIQRQQEIAQYQQQIQQLDNEVSNRKNYEEYLKSQISNRRENNGNQ